MMNGSVDGSHPSAWCPDAHLVATGDQHLDDDRGRRRSAAGWRSRLMATAPKLVINEDRQAGAVKAEARGDQDACDGGERGPDDPGPPADNGMG